MLRQATTKLADDLHSLLKDSGLRPTFVRRAVLEILRDSPRVGMRAERICCELIRRHGPVPADTIYRCLNTMESRGVVTRAWDATRQASTAMYFLLSRRNGSEACRFYCRCCGKFVEVIDAVLADALREHARALDFLPFAEALRVDSLCIGCSNFSRVY